MVVATYHIGSIVIGYKLTTIVIYQMDRRRPIGRFITPLDNSAMHECEIQFQSR